METGKLLIQHVEIMQKHGPNSAEREDFVNAHRDDKEFVELAAVSQALYIGLNKRHKQKPS